jgi:hypothetical protein
MIISDFKRGISMASGFLALLLPVLAGSVLLAQSLYEFSAGEIVSASEMNANFRKLPPVGAILPWHKTLTGVPALPDGWMECDGSPITDTESPMNGQNTPNLNDRYQSHHARGLFLRGDTTSGTFEDDAFQGHWHAVPTGHRITQTTGGELQDIGTQYGNNDSLAGDSVNDAITDGTNGTPRTASETRPASMSVVWIIRVK